VPAQVDVGARLKVADARGEGLEVLGNFEFRNCHQRQSMTISETRPAPHQRWTPVNSPNQSNRPRYTRQVVIAEAAEADCKFTDPKIKKWDDRFRGLDGADAFLNVGPDVYAAKLSAAGDAKKILALGVTWIWKWWAVPMRRFIGRRQDKRRSLWSYAASATNDEHVASGSL
jgi:hypothetical protein